MKKTAKVVIGLLALNGVKPVAAKLVLKNEALRTRMLEKMVQPGTSDDEIRRWALGLKKICGWDTSYGERYLRRIRHLKRESL